MNLQSTPAYSATKGSFSPTEEQVRQAKKFNVHPLIIHLLALRNVTQDRDIELFLFPSLGNLPDPFTLLGMEKAVSLVAFAIKNCDDIIIWGDYDVDGITATCLLVTFFKRIGKNVSWYIPDRFSEGYGLNIPTLNKIHSKAKGEYPLLITVDCGISNYDEIVYAKNIGFRLIVTDHHELPTHTVDADVVLNPKQEHCGFGDKNLAGVGMAFYLAAGIRSHLNSEGYFTEKIPCPNLKDFLDLVAIGTIADMVPLTPTNRILVKAGFETLSETRNVGISALLKSSDIFPGTIVSDDISFSLAPKLNAAGRLGKVDIAMELLLCSDKQKASKLANKLTNINGQRKRLCKQILEITLTIDSKQLITNNNCIVISGEYHLGVLGIVASQLVSLYRVPAIILSPDPSKNDRKILKGSGRSIQGVNLITILRKCDKYLLKYGGHAMAAGLTLPVEHLDMFKNYFSSLLEKATEGKPPSSMQPVDADLSIEKTFDLSFLEQFNRLEPFGVGNTKPVFADCNASIYDYKVIGRNGDHLKILFRGKYTNRQGIGFNLGHKGEVLQEKRKHTVIFSPTLNRFNAGLTWEAKLLDIL